MFDILKASRRPARLTDSPGFVASAAVHVLIAGAVLYQGARLVAANVPSWTEIVERALYIAPPSVVSRASREQVAYRAESGAGGERAPNADQGEAARGAWRSPNASAGTAAGDANDALPAPSAQDVNAFLVIEVERAAETDPTSAAPNYPPQLMQAGIEGYAAMRFVVDSTGLVDPATISVLDATHPAFAEAVRSAMPRMKFQPARIGARPVRQLSEQLFRFQIVKPDSTRAVAAPPPPPDRFRRLPTDPPGPIIRTVRP